MAKKGRRGGPGFKPKGDIHKKTTKKVGMTKGYK